MSGLIGNISTIDLEWFNADTNVDYSAIWSDSYIQEAVFKLLYNGL